MTPILDALRLYVALGVAGVAAIACLALAVAYRCVGFDERLKADGVPRWRREELGAWTDADGH